MAYFYYQDGANLRQIEADNYQQLSGDNATVDFTWPMKDGPIRASFGRPIVKVLSLGDSFSKIPSGGTFEPCPTDLNYSGNSIYHEFDTLYDDNRGSCSYRVTVSGCITKFYKAGIVTLTLNDCPPINEDPRNLGCSECCRSLLPTLRSLHI